MIRKAKHIFLIMLFLAGVFSLQAQNKRVAVWGPNVPQGSEEISIIELRIANSRFRDAISNMSGIELISRTDVDNILNELKFQGNGLVSENDKKLIGQMKGVDIIVSLVLSKGYGMINIESSFIDVETAMVIGSTQSVLALANNPEDLASKCVELAEKLTGVTSTTSATSRYYSAFGDGIENDLPFTIGSISFKMVFVKGGTFVMGCTSEQGEDCEDNERPTHNVTVGNFWMGETEVTVAMFRTFVLETGYRTDAEKEGWAWRWMMVDGKWKWNKVNGLNWMYDDQGNARNRSEDNHPVLYVSWNDAVEFCKWLSRKTGMTFRLPTEAEWEYAARGGNKCRGYIYSGGNNINNLAWYGNKISGTTANGRTHQVATLLPNELGLYDMSGNVCEWCADWYGSYGSSSQTNPRGPASGSSRVMRGGSWSGLASGCRAAHRSSSSPGARRYDGGFRLALVLR